MAEKEKKEKECKEGRHLEELAKVRTEKVELITKEIQETVVSASSVGDVEKGLVTGSGVGQAVKKIEQGKGSSQQSTESSQQEEKK